MLDLQRGEEGIGRRASVVAAASARATQDRRAEVAIQLKLLGGFDLRQEDQSIRLPVSAQRLVAFLALHDRPLQRLYVAGCLWLDSTQEHANANLRTALWRLRRPGCVVVRATPSDLALADGVVVDLDAASAAARRALSHEDERGDLDELCLAGDLLPGWYDDWLMIERERFRQLRVHALESLCEHCATVEEFADAAAAGLAAVAAEPLRESAHRTLIRAHLAEGNVGEAIRQYTIYRDLLRSQLGIEPSRQLQDLVGALRLPATQAARLGLGAATFR
jgi:DNA-binding SARP family transcriptional activator